MALALALKEIHQHRPGKPGYKATFMERGKRCRFSLWLGTKVRYGALVPSGLSHRWATVFRNKACVGCIAVIP
jgi:hypothetical protein